MLTLGIEERSCRLAEIIRGIFFPLTFQAEAQISLCRVNSFPQQLVAAGPSGDKSEQEEWSRGAENPAVSGPILNSLLEESVGQGVQRSGSSLTELSLGGPRDSARAVRPSCASVSTSQHEKMKMATPAQHQEALGEQH